MPAMPPPSRMPQTRLPGMCLRIVLLGNDVDYALLGVCGGPNRVSFVRGAFVWVWRPLSASLCAITAPDDVEEAEGDLMQLEGDQEEEEDYPGWWLDMSTDGMGSNVQMCINATFPHCALCACQLYLLAWDYSGTPPPSVQSFFRT